MRNTRKVTSYASLKKPKPKKARTRVTKVNAKRKGQRFPGRREPKYLAWLRTQPCVVLGTTSSLLVQGPHLGLGSAYGSEHWYARMVTIVPAHNPSRGAGGYDRDALPLDSVLHDEQHRIGIKSFCAKYNLDWQAEVVKHRARYAESIA